MPHGLTMQMSGKILLTAELVILSVQIDSSPSPFETDSQSEEAVGPDMSASCQGDGVPGESQVCAQRLGCKELLVSITGTKLICADLTSSLKN